MRVRINRLGSVFVAAVALAAPAFAATSSESSPTDTDSRWIPSFSFSGGALVQVMDSASSAHCQLGRPQQPVQQTGSSQFVNRLACRDPEAEMVPPPVTPMLHDPLCPDEPSPDGRRACLRPNTDEHDVAVSPFVAASLQLMTPRVRLLPSSPRFFVGGEFVTLWAQERDIAKEAKPAALAWPSNEDFPEAIEIAGPTLAGVGSAVTSEVQTYSFGARVGMAFPFHFRERRMWLKPSFGWLRYDIDMEGTIVASIKDDNVTSPFRGPGVREITVAGSASETFDGIGPGLELEMEAARMGPLGIALFINANAYKMLGDTEFSFSDTIDCPAYDPMNPTGGCASSLINMPNAPGPMNPAGPVPDANIGADTYDADFEFSVDDWAYRAGVGIRFHWLGR